MNKREREIRKEKLAHVKWAGTWGARASGPLLYYPAPSIIDIAMVHVTAASTVVDQN
jgi:hypothetical protein